MCDTKHVLAKFPSFLAILRYTMTYQCVHTHRHTYARTHTHTYVYMRKYDINSRIIRMQVTIDGACVTRVDESQDRVKRMYRVVSRKSSDDARVSHSFRGRNRRPYPFLPREC